MLEEPDVRAVRVSPVAELESPTDAVVMMILLESEHTRGRAPSSSGVAGVNGNPLDITDAVNPLTPRASSTSRANS